ncbi:phage tail tape measure protein [Sideroxydans lithotrophicus]|uniref:Tail tape measure protein TP901 core region n=1 Tax=Sideroxydans lithotrophicus (strain ES-1) TaxID=580332 RepID=D5CUE6_SIDLE|nr:phage tail tape measure protein [Sideroxydans lithotrophicus]ADE10481.1 tail tape measure protein TP901 core region [Sideroxydans lithotrophicus ES-1]
MSGKNYELSLVMRLRDMASRGFNLAQRDIQSGIDKTNKATASLTKTVSQYHKTRDAGAKLGIRSEHDIQREIQRTQAAYERLAKSGTMSMRDQARAADAARSKIRELNNEMGKYSLGQRAMRGLQTGASVAAGVMAGGYVMSKPINQTMDYGMRLAQMSNTAFSERNTLGRIMGKRELDAAVVASVRHGGGTRESAAGALDTLIASGAMSAKDSMGMLPSLMRASTASGADAGELAQIGIRGMQTMGIKPGEMGKILDMAITAGQQGGFELKDMAKWLPQQMAAAKLSGISGTSGMAKLLAANQASAITAGTKDEAGNNLVNLLAKINSRDTAVDAQRMGINLSGTLAAARGKGMDSLDAFVGVVDSVVAKNAEFQALQAKLKTTTGADRRGVLESQADILQGSAIGQMVQDRQALMALVGIMGNRGYMSDVQKKTLAGEGAAEKNYAVIAEEAGFKVQQAANEKDIASQNAFEKLTPLVGAVADGFTTMAQQYPMLTAATVAATTALTALAVASGAASLTSMLGGKGGGLTGLLSKGRGLAAGAGSLAMRGGAMALSGAGAAVAGAGAAGYGLGTLLYNAIDETEFANNLGGAIATVLASLGNKEAQDALNVTLNLDGEQIAQAVNMRNARTSSRY